MVKSLVTDGGESQKLKSKHDQNQKGKTIGEIVPKIIFTIINVSGLFSLNDNLSVGKRVYTQHNCTNDNHLQLRFCRVWKTTFQSALLNGRVSADSQDEDSFNRQWL